MNGLWLDGGCAAWGWDWLIYYSINQRVRIIIIVKLYDIFPVNIKGKFTWSILSKNDTLLLTDMEFVHVSGFCALCFLLNILWCMRSYKTDPFSVMLIACLTFNKSESSPIFSLAQLLHTAWRLSEKKSQCSRVSLSLPTLWELITHTAEPGAPGELCCWLPELFVREALELWSRSMFV